MSYENVWLAIIAGGKGTRLFPISHEECPKQFCQLDKDNTFIQATVRRYVNLDIKPEHIIIIVTNQEQRNLAYEQTKWLGILENNIVTVEPFYDFAGCMVLAAEIIAEKSKYSLDKTVIINTPADQHVANTAKLKKAVSLGVENALKQRPTILGVKIGDIPTMTGLGHAIYRKNESSIAKIESFIEKPNQKAAEEMLENGNTVAYTGIGIWTADAILKKISSSMISSAGLKTDELMQILIDKLDVIISNFEWYDCGTLKSLYDISPKTPNHHNATICGKVERINCRNSLFYAVDGVELHASTVKNTAIVVNSVNGKIFVAIVNLGYSQSVKELAKKYDDIKEILASELSLSAENNDVANMNMKDEAYVGFIGVHNMIVTILKQSDGSVLVLVKQTS